MWGGYTYKYIYLYNGSMVELKVFTRDKAVDWLTEVSGIERRLGAMVGGVLFGQHSKSVRKLFR